MSSIGASYAGVYVMQKRQKEKLVRMKQEERARRGDGSSTLDDQDIRPTQYGRKKKVHPGDFPASDSTGPAKAYQN
ncbi:hypothetical protein RchiOBHm_Chr2g0115661 [Rosa chinensis]|uniref:Uncharacterized protein n=1 Tax=Rosa chinensis TaxID=74649 RepID=A0A2P6RR24_ROSCH|nr:hypothetical protein RchiOBHm_Chr2g0115661 [Rosa chinensis]